MKSIISKAYRDLDKKMAPFYVEQKRCMIDDHFCPLFRLELLRNYGLENLDDRSPIRRAIS